LRESEKDGEDPPEVGRRLKKGGTDDLREQAYMPGILYEDNGMTPH
jgi:hypothetical protein